MSEPIATAKLRERLKAVDEYAERARRLNAITDRDIEDAELRKVFEANKEPSHGNR